MTSTGAKKTTSRRFNMDIYPREGILYTEILTYSSPLSKKKKTKIGYRRVSVQACVNKI